MNVVFDGLSPRQTLAPNDASEVAAALLNAREKGAIVAPCGGRTMLDLGAPLERVDLVLSLEKQNRVLDYQPANLTVRAEAGISLGELNRTLAERGQCVPLDPPCHSQATIGGILATNASGPARIRYGSARDLVIGMRVALADGQIIKGGGQVVKNVAGYDLPKLFIGSLGTLGIIVEATFKLAPLPQKTATLIASFAELTQAGKVALRVLQSPLLPLGVVLLDPTASRQFELSDHWTLAVRFGSTASAVMQQLNELTQWARANSNLLSTTLEEDAGLWSRLADFSADKEIVLKVSILPTQIAQAGKMAETIAGQRGLSLSFLGNAAGILLLALKGEEDQVKDAIVVLRQWVAAVGGYLVVQRAPRALRERVDVWGPLKNRALMQRLKQELDPQGILNPGRFGAGV